MRKRIHILAMGGTIAGKAGDSAATTGYQAGAVGVEELIAAVPQIKDVAEVTGESIAAIDSKDITAAEQLKLAGRVRDLLLKGDVDGIVVTHGTDTMDETAYFVSLTVKCEKAVIFTGSMKPATAKNPDGPENLLGAVRAAAGFAVDDDPPANLVWVYFAGELFDARSVQKCSASAINAMGVNAPGEGSNWNSLKEQNFFDVSKLESLPRVNVVYFTVDANPKILEYAACVSDGLVIAGAGSGEFSLAWAKVLENIDIPVVVSTRIHHGLVTLNETLAPGRICAGRLPPQKAAVLLRLALTATTKVDEIKRVFAL